MDLLVVEKDGAGDLSLKGNDLETTDIESLVYLSMFGGSEWWANNLFAEESAQIICRTEQVLEEVTLNSSGRLRIESAVRQDLAYIPEHIPGSTVEVQVIIISDDRLEIQVWLTLTQMFTDKDVDSLPKKRFEFKYRVFTKQFTKQFS